uniref:Flap endonuclease GEN chromatin organization modifier domain-containing protein n=1 Tax=Labrus bergylta TaxID=56723 RepID=A0A3Q3FI04_9LABR
VSEGVVKKVAHCHVCRHPGSAKAHERGGCMLCNSEQFCQPQDFDYQCPCDWHRYEQTRQATSFEANIRKKTLASSKFPFTEIIHEFLISKDKPVSHFKRRQPNILLMQKFALQKMEWPTHYTSEKVLVLMTYDIEAEGEECCPCFEIIWRTPEHFVFPEDRPVDDQHEVRTVEEESLFRVAFPEIVESYLRDKAQAAENKTKSKKYTLPYNKKEKQSDDSEGISDLLALMTLQSSSDTPPQTLLPVISNPEEPEVLVLDTPVKHDHQQTSKKDHGNLVDCSNIHLPRAESDTIASPSVSAVIDALHLSDINWDASSFMSSPTPQPAANHNTEPRLSKTTHSDVNEAEGKIIQNEVKESESKSAPESCSAECPLRERLLMRNTAKQLAPLKLIPSKNSKPNGEIPIKGSSDSKESGVYRKAPLSATNKSETAAYNSKQQLKSTTQTQSKTNDTCNISRKPPQKYRFVKKAFSSSAVPPTRCQPDPGQSNKDKSVPESTKRSVCVSVCTSSEESDAENQLLGAQRKAKNKTVNKLKGRVLVEPPLKPISAPKPAKEAHNVQFTLIPKPKRRVDPKLKRVPVLPNSKCPNVSPAYVNADAFCPNPASPVSLLESDDSVICTESPLPLSERLRLKFLK